MAVTFKHTESGREVTVPEPDDEPVRQPRSRARRLARFAAAEGWERVEPKGSSKSASSKGSTKSTE